MTVSHVYMTEGQYVSLNKRVRSSLECLPQCGFPVMSGTVKILMRPRASSLKE